jgi:ferrochelatase
MRDNEIRRAAVFTTSAWSGYSGCTQYSEDLDRARRAAGPGAPELVKLRPYFDHPLFVEIFADNIAAAAPPTSCPTDARLVFTAHSVPVAADDRSAPSCTAAKCAYAARLVAAAAGIRRLRPGLAVALGPAAGAVAGARCRRPRHAVGSPRRAPRPSSSARSVSSPTTSRWCGISTPSCVNNRRGGGRRCARRHAQRRPAVRPARGGPDRRTSLRPCARAGWSDRIRSPGCAAGINGEPCRPPHCVADRSD